jgi:superfamily II DNA or RNA helicase
MSLEYNRYIDSKRKRVEATGFEKRDSHPMLFEWQNRIVQWAVRRGRSALFADCGLGKTPMQLTWAMWVFQHTGKPVVIHCPVGVRQQTKREASKFSITEECLVEVVDDPSQVVDGINLINYEKLHKFEGIDFGGVVLDESQILKGLTSKTREMLTERYAGLRFKLACTATPAPNDHTELGNHAEFLGVCASVDMLNRYFYHDSGNTSEWVLMGHAKKEFWSWVAQWAVCISTPSDIGGNDDGYILPELKVIRHIVEAPLASNDPAFLFNISGISATSIHEEKRLTNEQRCRKAADIVKSVDGPCIVWCDTNYEADELQKQIPEAIEVRGSLSDKEKERLLFGFSNNEYRVLISKGSIAGVGMNWQHCNNMVFAGLGYSFETYYQSVRRCWRFGQQNPVNVHIVLAETEGAINSAISRKENDFAAMRCGMSEAMRECTLDQFGLREGKVEYKRHGAFPLPSFLQGEMVNG